MLRFWEVDRATPWTTLTVVLTLGASYIVIHQQPIRPRASNVSVAMTRFSQRLVNFQKPQPKWK